MPTMGLPSGSNLPFGMSLPPAMNIPLMTSPFSSSNGNNSNDEMLNVGLLRLSLVVPAYPSQHVRKQFESRVGDLQKIIERADEVRP